MTMSDEQQTLDLIRALSGLSEEYLKAVARRNRAAGLGIAVTYDAMTEGNGRLVLVRAPSLIAAHLATLDQLHVVGADRHGVLNNVRR